MGRMRRVGLVVLTLLASVAYQHAVVRSTASHLAPPLHTIPLVIGPWRGIPDRLPPEVLSVLRPDDYMLRW